MPLSKEETRELARLSHKERWRWLRARKGGGMGKTEFQARLDVLVRERALGVFGDPPDPRTAKTKQQIAAAVAEVAKAEGADVEVYLREHRDVAELYEQSPSHVSPD